MRFHDRIHKDLLHRMFADFLEAFLPEVAKEVDPDSVEFLEQEFSLRRSPPESRPTRGLDRRDPVGANTALPTPGLHRRGAFGINAP